MANRIEIQDLLDAIQLPKQIVVLHRPAHTRDTTVISKGNALADAAAKAAVHQPVVKIVAVASDKSSRPIVDHPEKLYHQM